MTDSYLLVRVPKSGSNSLKTVMQQMLPDHDFAIVPNLSGQDRDFSFIEYLRALRKFTRRAFTAHGVLSKERMWSKIDQLSKEKNIIVSGHIPLNEIPHPELFKLITIIRHPVSRLISEYKWKQHGFNKRGPIRKLYHRGRNYYANKSLSEYVDFLADHADIYSNITTKFVTGLIDHPDPASFVLEHYWHYGLLEYSDVFARTLSEKTGIHCNMPHNNLSPLRSDVEVSSRVIDKFTSFNQKDFELYSGLERLIKEQQKTVIPPQIS